MIWGILALIYFWVIGWWWFFLFFPYMAYVMLVRFYLKDREERKKDKEREIRAMQERDVIGAILEKVRYERKTRAEIKIYEARRELKNEYKEDREQFKKKHNTQSSLTSV